MEKTSLKDAIRSEEGSQGGGRAVSSPPLLLSLAHALLSTPSLCMSEVEKHVPGVDRFTPAPAPGPLPAAGTAGAQPPHPPRSWSRPESAGQDRLGDRCFQPPLNGALQRPGAVNGVVTHRGEPVEGFAIEIKAEFFSSTRLATHRTCSFTIWLPGVNDVGGRIGG